MMYLWQSSHILSGLFTPDFLIFYKTDTENFSNLYVFVPFSLIIPLQFSLSSCILLQAIRRTHITPSIFFLEISSAQYPISSFAVISTTHLRGSPETAVHRTDHSSVSESTTVLPHSSETVLSFMYS